MKWPHGTQHLLQCRRRLDTEAASLSIEKVVTPTLVLQLSGLGLPHSCKSNDFYYSRNFTLPISIAVGNLIGKIKDPSLRTYSKYSLMD